MKTETASLTDVINVDRSGTANARAVLSLLLLGAVAMFASYIIGTRGIDVGNDTSNYAAYFLQLKAGFSDTRFEPGFVIVSKLLALTGIGIKGYQAALFAILLLTVLAASWQYYRYLESPRGYLTFITASFMLLLLSPVFVNASFNVVRQGLASLLVFTALLAFHERQWRNFVLFGVLATSFHYSSLLYLFFAPALLLSPRMLRTIAALAFLAYCTGLSMLLVRAIAPAVYVFVMDYSVDADYRAGVRLDFAVFAIFWYLLPYLAGRLVSEPFRERIKDSTAVYLVLILPFFAIGWGNYSNRYLLPPEMAASLLVAAMICHSRIPLLRNPLLLRGGLVFAGAVFSYYVANQIKI